MHLISKLKEWSHGFTSLTQLHGNFLKPWVRCSNKHQFEPSNVGSTYACCAYTLKGREFTFCCQIKSISSCVCVSSFVLVSVPSLLAHPTADYKTPALRLIRPFRKAMKENTQQLLYRDMNMYLYGTRVQTSQMNGNNTKR